MKFIIITLLLSSFMANASDCPKQETSGTQESVWAVAQEKLISIFEKEMSVSSDYELTHFEYRPDFNGMCGVNRSNAAITVFSKDSENRECSQSYTIIYLENNPKNSEYPSDSIKKGFSFCQ